MFNKPTVFIVGAGASAECGLSTGAQLKDKIRVGLDFRFDDGNQLRNGDDALLRLLRSRFSNANLYTRAGPELSETIVPFPSIDEALHWWRARPEMVELGKLAIAYYILGDERRSLLIGKDGSIDVKAANDTWLATFISIALSGLERDEANRAFENVSIINFNYDRTIETYLYWALQQRGAISSNEAAQCVAHLKVIRPYGSIGKLDWEEQSGIRFGGNNNPDEASQVANNIRTFTEQIQEETVPASINEALENASLVVFLGFGFHQQNTKLFKTRTQRTFRPNAPLVMATAKGIDDKNYPAIVDYLFTDCGLQAARLVACKAEELMTQLRPTISMAAG